MSIRSTSKAIILNQDKILLIKNQDRHNGEYYSLPGGGQNPYETMHDAIVRECLEETGYTVLPIRFAGICEEICDDEEIRDKYPDYAHKMLHIFLCKLAKEELQKPTEIDNMQIGIEWISINDLDNIRILPAMVGENLKKMINDDSSLFLGSGHIAYNHG